MVADNRALSLCSKQSCIFLASILTALLLLSMAWYLAANKKKSPESELSQGILGFYILAALYFLASYVYPRVPCIQTEVISAGETTNEGQNIEGEPNVTLQVIG